MGFPGVFAATSLLAVGPIGAQGADVSSVVEKCPSQILRQARASAQVTASHQTMAARPVTAGQDRGASVRRTSSTVPGDETIPELDEPRVRPVRGPPPGTAGDPAEVTLRLAHDHDRIAGDMGDIVMDRLFSAGLALETALGLIGGQPGAGNVQEAIGELDLAIADFRNMLFEHYQPDSPSSGQPG
jgi:hypothetical protein